MIVLKLRLKGGAGSGHRGHLGRPGKRGGSIPGGGSGGAQGAQVENLLAEQFDATVTEWVSRSIVSAWVPLSTKWPEVEASLNAMGIDARVLSALEDEVDGKPIRILEIRIQQA